MQASAEIRYFWKTAVPEAVEAWYRGGITPGGGATRTDEYLKDLEQKELGVKRRGGKPGVEVKGLVGFGKELPAPFRGRVEIWSKWSSTALSVDTVSTIRIVKQRWLRKFDSGRGGVAEIPMDEQEKPKDGRSLPSNGCNLELTKLSAPLGEVWWTLGFEAFGQLQSVEGNLLATVDWLAGGAPNVDAAMTASYPEWLSRLGAATNL
jgi:hypothetical protein